MNRGQLKGVSILIFAAAVIFLNSNGTNAQGMYSSSSGGWNTGYGTVYGSHGYALATQDMFRQMERATNQNMIRDITRSGSSSRTKGSTSTASRTAAAPAPVVRNYGVFRPDATVDTAKALADTLGDSPEEKALIKNIYTATKALYQKEAAAKGWKASNMAGGLTFFTAVAMTVYHDGGEPSDEAANNYYNAVNGALDEMPELAKVTNTQKQAFNNVLIGFGGLMLATYSEGKQKDDAPTLESAKKLAGMLIEMVLKTDPEKLRIDNGRIVIK